MVVKKSPKKTPPNAGMKRLHLVFKGRVQGVGFRFTAERIALELGVKGWVRNLPNGDVEILAEGKEKALADTLERIKTSEIGRHITKTVMDWQEYRNEFRDFRV